MNPQATRIVVAAVTLVTVIAACGVAVSRFHASRATVGTDLGFSANDLSKFSSEVAALLRSKTARPVAGGALVRRNGQQPTLWADSVDADYSRRSLYEYSYTYSYDGVDEYDTYDAYEYEPDTPDDVAITTTSAPQTTTTATTAETAAPTSTTPQPSPTTPAPTIPAKTPTTATPAPPRTTSVPTPAPPTATTPHPQLSLLRGVVYDGYIKGADVVFQTLDAASPSSSPIAITDKFGKFEFNLPKDTAGHLFAEPNGTDIFSKEPVPFRLALPFADQVSGGKFAISPFTTLAYFARDASLTADKLYARVIASLGLSLPETADLASFDAIQAVPKPGTPGRRADIKNLLAASNIMSVVSTTAGVYSGVCRLPKVEAGEWVFEALADAGPATEAQLSLNDEQFLEDMVMTNEKLIANCIDKRRKLDFKRSFQQRNGSNMDESVREELKSLVTKVAKTVVQLNQYVEEMMGDDTQETEQLVEHLVRAGVMSQRISEKTEDFSQGAVNETELDASLSIKNLKQSFRDIDIDVEHIQRTLEEMYSVDEAGEPIPRPVMIKESRQYSVAEIVGISVGPLLGVVAISFIAFLVLTFVKRRAGGKVESFNAGDAEEGLIGNEEGRSRRGSAEIAAASPAADDSTYYTMPAPQPPPSPIRFPTKKDPLAPAGPREPAEQEEMDAVLQARKLEQEQARAGFDAIIKAQLEAMKQGTGGAAQEPQSPSVSEAMQGGVTQEGSSPPPPSPPLPPVDVGQHAVHEEEPSPAAH